MSKDLRWMENLDDILDAQQDVNDIDSLIVTERGLEPTKVKPCPYCGFISSVWGWHLEYDTSEPFGKALHYSLAMRTLEYQVKPEHYQDAIELYVARYGIQGRRYWIRIGDNALELPTARGWSITTDFEVEASWRNDLKERGWLTEWATSEELTGPLEPKVSRHAGHRIPRRVRKQA